MTARACLDGGFLDELELYVIPRLLGDGIPLFARRKDIVALELLQTLPFHNGVGPRRRAYTARVAFAAHPFDTASVKGTDPRPCAEPQPTHGQKVADHSAPTPPAE